MSQLNSSQAAFQSLSWLTTMSSRSPAGYDPSVSHPLLCKPAWRLEAPEISAREEPPTAAGPTRMPKLIYRRRPQHRLSAVRDPVMPSDGDGSERPGTVSRRGTQRIRPTLRHAASCRTAV